MKNLFIPLIMFVWINGHAQVGIGTISPDVSSALEIKSTNRGLLIPRLSSNQRILIDSPAKGLLIFNTTLNCLELNKGNPTSPNWFCLQTDSISSSSNGTAIVSSYECSYAYGALYQGQSSSEAKQMLNVIVESVGTYQISATANGVTFSAAGSFTSVGQKTIVLIGSGSPTTSGTFDFHLNVTPHCAFQREVKVLPPTGSFYSLSNGTAPFSSNVRCTSSVISATHTALTCSGPVITQRDTYDVVLLNGQCWMKKNLNEIPSWPCSSNVNTGCNIWNNTPVSSDFGYWGYFNDTSIFGNAGWRATNAIKNEGLLYQHSAAMNGSTNERAQGVCPLGWHIPSDCEWKYLEHGIGLSITAQNAINRSSTLFQTLRDSSFGGTNTTGFSILLVGNRSTSGQFVNRNTRISLWTSSIYSSQIYKTVKTISNTSISTSMGETYTANSVRCLKD